MTDSIDLDEMDVGDDEEDGNHGDWFWREDGRPPEESSDEMSAVEQLSQSASDNTAEEAGSTGTAEEDRVPGVPQFSEGPAGMPEDQGGAGAGSGSSDPPEAGGQTSQGQGTAEAHGIEEPADMTMAMTYKAAHYFEDPQVVFVDAHGWADWVGLVGEVSVPAIRKFQRDEGLELDFFGGSDTGPAERLAEVDEESMFFAERMVLVGVGGDDEWMAEEAGWEFVPLEEAAEKADWRVKEDMLD